MHTIELHERTLCAEDGLLLGNGDLSVSVYQTADCIVWRFGKGDVWDRRLDLSDDPKPAHIEEIARGIKEEGWKCGPYGGPVEATRGTQDPHRMHELCQGAPPSYKRRPYPCPKPVGELALHLPPDHVGMQIDQRLLIEKAVLHISCPWPSGVSVELQCFIPPWPNVLVLHWKLSNWNEQTRTAPSCPPVWFSLYRWADPTIQQFAARFFGEHRHPAFRDFCDPKVTPLPPPTVQQDGGLMLIEQTFPPDALFPEGFRYVMVPFALEATVEPVDMTATAQARLHLLPQPEAMAGSVVVAVATSGDAGGASQQVHRLRTMLQEGPEEAFEKWAAENQSSAEEFWAKSRVAIADPLLEALWYETLHARRCAYRNDTIPPGLFLPSTVQDYSHWHGDYHTNYNFQEPFWGDYTANHLELGDAYFEGMKFLVEIGRKIARDYYNCRGAFIQLTGYPIQAEEDPLGIAPMGRMAYMTGWAMNQYWWRYLYTLDLEWLRSTGYPVLRDGALFYTDFLTRGNDGLYHAFPSNQGEDGFTGEAKDYTDRAQVMQHVRYCLRAAIQASEILKLDEDLRSRWRDRLDNCAGDDGQPPVDLNGLDKERYEANPPEFGSRYPHPARTNGYDGSPWPAPAEWLYTWYFGQYPWTLMQAVRSGDFSPDRDLTSFRNMVQRWRHPNGLIWGMAVALYGHAGAWTESLGVIAPVQEMMLQSWDGALRLFPAWPRNLAARFENLRAQGAFLVTAAWSHGEVTELEILSEKGALCRLYVPWGPQVQVVDDQGQLLELTPEPCGRVSFPTRAGGKYTFRLLQS